jgi:hypothetical protein
MWIRESASQCRAIRTVETGEMFAVGEFCCPTPSECRTLPPVDHDSISF